jgi:hypothetical protein
MRRALLYVSATFAHATLLLGVVAAMRGCEAGMALGADRVGRAVQTFCARFAGPSRSAFHVLAK